MLRRRWPVIAVASAVILVVVLLNIGRVQPHPPEDIGSDQEHEVILGGFVLIGVFSLAASIWFWWRLKRLPTPDTSATRADEQNV